MRSSAYTFLFENEFCLHLGWKIISTSKAERLTSFWYRGRGTRKWPIRPTTFVRHIVDVLSENCACVDGWKSWRMLVAHDSRKQQSYRLNLPLERVDVTHEKHWKTYLSLSFLITEQTFSLASVFHINSGFSWLAAQRINDFLRIINKS